MDNRFIHKEAVPPTRLALRLEPTTCRWCRSCELICSLSHEGVCSPTLSRIRLWVNTLELELEVGLCAQCRVPACSEACPVEGAMVVDTATGAMLIVESECIACGECAAACPFNTEGIIVFPSRAGDAYVKCDLCGGKPRCVEYCPTGALRLEQRET
jgi:Fe-S-cluster-containing hydrogenase component 2